MTVESDLLRQAMRFWTTGVTIVTAAHAGVQHGMTVSSFTSISITPPQVLISVAHNTRTHDLIVNSHHFGVNILDSSQMELSDRFAGRKLASGTPLLKQGLAQFDCRVLTTVDSGTNTLFIGEVLAVQSVDQGDPLIYFNRGYQKINGA